MRATGLASAVLLTLILSTFVGMGIAGNDDAACANAVRVQRANEATIRFDMKATPVKRIDASYFGFNIEWVGFQADLWDPGAGTVHPDIVHWLHQLGGALYRYPGGTVANHFQWRHAVGSARSPQKAVDWTGPIRMDFGPAEYFQFLRAVDGKAWLVANMQGEFAKELPVEHMAAEAGDFATAAGKLSAEAGVPIVRWELGNELDRAPSRWPAEKYAANANAMAAAIRKSDKDTRFVAFWPDYDAYPGVKASEYARRLTRMLDPDIHEFAQHLYFDGPPGGPPVTNRLVHMCNMIGAAKAEGKTPAVWVTEFARWPPGKVDDPNWKSGFPLTANLSSAISTADFLIGTTQIREVRGGMIHSLSSSKGPWPMFHRHGTRFDPSAVFLSLLLLRQGLVGDVLPTSIASPYDAATGNPLVRAVAVASPDKKSLWLTLINRGNAEIKASVTGVPLSGASKMQVTDIVGLHDSNHLANNFAMGDRVALKSIDKEVVQYQSNHDLTVELKPNSIISIRLQILGSGPK